MNFISNMENYTSLGTSSTTSSTGAKKTSQNDKIANIFLVGTAALFVLSLTYTVSSSRFASGTKAQVAISPTIPVTRSESVIPPVAKYPTKYNDEVIPASLFGSSATVDQYKAGIVMQYYMYKDLIQENNLDYTLPEEETFAEMEKNVVPMMNTVNDNIVTKVDLAFVKARFAFTPEESFIKTKLGNDLKAKAESFINAYKTQFEEGGNPQATVDNSNLDKDLMTLNNYEKNAVINRYTPDNNLFFSDKGFDEFLLSQEEGKTSDVYTLKLADDKPYAYVVVYPIKIEKKQYLNMNEVVQDKLTKFSY